MKKRQKTYNPGRAVCVIFMMLSLLWLTVSTPFTFASHQNLVKLGKIVKLSTDTANEEDATNPFGNNTEKGNTDASPFSEEYIHPSNKVDYPLSLEMQFYNCEKPGIYNAFHGEILVPPPNAA
jgi:hypothetical protein